MTNDNPADGEAGVDIALDAIDDWRGERLKQLREWILGADGGITEAIKWRKPSNPLGVPTWEHHGIICTGECYADKVKLTFAAGAHLDDVDGLFNSSLGGKTRRAIDVREADDLDRDAFVGLVRAAVAYNIDKQ